MKQTLLILAMSSIVAYGQDKTTLGYNGKPVKQPKYKDLTLRASNGMAIERIMWGADSTLSIRLIDSNEKQTTMKYKLIETK